MSVQRVLFLLVVVATSAACGGGSNPPQDNVVIADEHINSIVVPPQPDATLNASSLAGVDSDSNGIRDDIDRLIATNFGVVQSDYSAAFNHAKTLQAALTTPSDATKLAHIVAVGCVDPAVREQLKSITTATLDTATRQSAYGNAFAGVELTYEVCAK